MAAINNINHFTVIPSAKSYLGDFVNYTLTK